MTFTREVCIRKNFSVRSIRLRVRYHNDIAIGTWPGKEDFQIQGIETAVMLLIINKSIINIKFIVLDLRFLNHACEITSPTVS